MSNEECLTKLNKRKKGKGIKMKEDEEDSLIADENNQIDKSLNELRPLSFQKLQNAKGFQSVQNNHNKQAISENSYQRYKREKAENFKIAEIEVELTGGKFEKIEISSKDNPEEIIEQFCQKNKIEGNLKNALKKLVKEKLASKNVANIQKDQNKIDTSNDSTYNLFEGECVNSKTHRFDNKKNEINQHNKESKPY